MVVKLAELGGNKFVENFHGVLKDMKKFVKDPRQLWHGCDLPNFSLRPREIWSLWLLCVVYNRIGSANLTFGETDDGDGILFDKMAGHAIPVEQVAAMDFPETSFPRGEDRVVQAIMHKASKGKEYATDKVLVVFFDGAHRFEPNKIAKAVNCKHHFERIYLVGLVTDRGGTEYSYYVIALNSTNTDIAIVNINPDFSGWNFVDFSKTALSSFGKIPP